MTILPQWLLRSAAYCLALLVVGFTIWLVVEMLATVRMVTFSIVAALLLSALLSWLVTALVRLRVPRWLAALLSVVVLLGACAASVFLVVNRALSQVSDLQKALAQGLEGIKQTLLQPPFSLTARRVEQVQDRVADALTAALPSPATGASLAIEFLSGIVLGIFLLFFLLKDGSRMWQWVLSWSPAPRRDQVDEAGMRAWHTLTSYVRGTVLVALADALGIGTAMLLLGVPLTASLALMVFIGAFVPIVGATVSGGLAVLATLVTLGPVSALVLLGAVLLVQQLEGNLLQPLIMGHALQLHPVAIVLAVTIGALIGGVLGAIVAVPALAVSYRVVSYLAGRD
jgi:predicted PurR-regulated permease PerM